MDFALRCNNLKCRTQLNERAVVTTCSVYQEYLAKSLTEKYNGLGTQVDKIIHDANTEIDSLNQKISGLQIDREKLQSENNSLVSAFREKSRKHQQTQELYDRLKRKEMTAATQSAAFESVDEVLGNINGRAGQMQNMHQQSASRQNTGFAAGLSHNPTPSRRVPLGNMSASNVNRSNYGGYGMSAGAKVGRQQGVPQSNLGQVNSNADHPGLPSQLSQNAQRYH
ncbi:MAG: hypothetical protein Q9170_005734 [Blastenia crenularia]